MALSESRRRRRSTRALLGYLEVHVFEASPRGLKKTMGVQRISSAWKTLIPGMSEIICRVEISGVAAQRAETRPVKAGKMAITWDEKVTLPVYEGAKELRLLLLSSGRGEAPPKTIANGGFYVEDIMASPSNCKWFELFAPGGNAGGTIKLSILYTAATPATVRRRQSVNAETQMEAQTLDGFTAEKIASKSFDSSETAINTDPIADSPPQQSKRRSVTVHVGVGPSAPPSQKASPLPPPNLSQKSSPVTAPLSSQRRASGLRERRSPKISTTPADLASEPPQSEPDNPRTDLLSAEIEGPCEEPANSVDVQEAEGGSDQSDKLYTETKDEIAPRSADASTTQNLTSAAEPVPFVHTATPSSEDAPQAADTERGSYNTHASGDTCDEARGSDSRSSSQEGSISMTETRATEMVSNTPKKQARGVPAVLLCGVTAVAAVLGAIVLGSKRGGSKKTRPAKAFEPPQSRADIVQYATGPRY